MSDPVLLAPGAPCACAANRRVRYAIPAVPGIPRGLVSCREVGGTGTQSVRHHDLPADATVAAHVPSVAR